MTAVSAAGSPPQPVQDGPTRRPCAGSAPDSDRTAAGYLLPALYQVDAAHWWTSGMRRVSHALLDGVALPAGPLLELGYGAGGFLVELSARFPERLVLGSELHPLALRGLPASAALGLLAADLHRLPLPAGSCAAIIALDVYDQQRVDLTAALLESWRVLRCNGILLLRVSALAWLHGPHDVAFGTGQRYTARQLKGYLADAGLRVERLTYANSLLLAPGVGLRLLQKLGLMTDVTSELGVSPRVNRLLRGFLAAEAHWLRRRNLPAGLSLYALARKQTHSEPVKSGSPLP